MGVVPPQPDFLETARRLCTDAGALLIFDEVITGFRVAWGGAQERYGVVPDLTTLGKIIGGGLPVGAFGGRADIMETVAPLGATYQAGTLSGNPLAMAAGIATLQVLAEPGVYERLEARAVQVCQGLVEAALGAGLPTTLNRVGAMMTLFFCEGPVTSFADATAGGHGAVRALLPPHARARRLPGAVAVRVDDGLARAHRRRRGPRRRRGRVVLRGSLGRSRWRAPSTRVPSRRSPSRA